MRNCPKCHKISKNDVECDKCGVQFKDIRGKDDPAPRTSREPCGWPDCHREALPTVKTPYGWLPLCLPHYDQYWLVKPVKEHDPNGHEHRKLMQPNENDSYRQRWYAERKQPFEPARKIESSKLELWTALHGREPIDP